MTKEIKKDVVWSATPTPFTNKMTVDIEDVGRMINHHIRLGVDGIMLAGTCGEGPWMLPAEQRRLVKASSSAAAGKIDIAVQVSDNSADRIVANAENAAEDGAKYAVIAPPYYLLNATPSNISNLYREAIRRSPLPVVIYDIGGRQVNVPNEILEEIYSEPNVIMVKDSSNSKERRQIALKVRERRSKLILMTGDEFSSVEHLKEGYNGMMLGGAILSGAMCRKILEAVASNDWDIAERWQDRVNHMLFKVYGGKNVACWLAGLKHTLVRLGIFSTSSHYLNFPLTSVCKNDIKEIIEKEREWLVSEKSDEIKIDK